MSPSIGRIFYDVSRINGDGAIKDSKEWVRLRLWSYYEGWLTLPKPKNHQKPDFHHLIRG